MYDLGKWIHPVDSPQIGVRKTYGGRACPVLTSWQHTNLSTSTFGDILFVQQCVMTHILKFVIQHNGAISISASKLNMDTL